MVVPVPPPMSLPTCEESKVFSVWFVYGATKELLVEAVVAVKSPGLLVTVTDVVWFGAEEKAANVPFMHGVV